MGKITGFMEYGRQTPEQRPVEERLHDFKEVYRPMDEEAIRCQAARCMDCGVPFCHSGCPLGNLCPEWNDLVYRGQWEKAWERLSATNNFPEFTGRLCPALCEEACVLGIHEAPTTIQLVEKTVIEYAFAHGLVKPEIPTKHTGKRVAVVGSGPSGLAAAQQLNRAGHEVTVFEKNEKPGGLLRYGIPDFKIEKWVIDRRLEIMAEEGVKFVTNTDPSAEVLKTFDAVVLATGSGRPRDLPIPGRELTGIHFALEYLQQQNRLLSAKPDGSEEWGRINAKGKSVIVIGGGDTGSDCVGTALRQGAREVHSFELMPMPPETRTEDQPWPFWPMKLRTSSSHKEGGDRFWSILTKEFKGYNGHVRSLVTINVEWTRPTTKGERPQLKENPNTRQEWHADLVLLALGFLGPETDNVIARLGVGVDERGNVKTGADYQSNVPGVFAAGDSRRGQSLIVWAISEGRECAVAVDAWLMGSSDLPRRTGLDLTSVKR
ncbi:MAG TPA: glutamate synthase subunit beta [Kiritimatiellia bacterium]|nr:glutamate synthase subunit beta [Kiritimatiellia bacterium]HPS09324.1 glutamate synthase subunit beta [Kiritimatiellia bacterium]